MKKILEIILPLVVIILAVYFLVLPRIMNLAVTSDFTVDHEGWQIAGDAQDGTSAPTYDFSGGISGGYISATDDRAGGTWYFVAPEKFLGNKSGYYGRSLSYYAKQSDITDQFEEADIIIEGTDATLYYRFPEGGPGTDWTAYGVILDGTADWRVQSYTGPKASDGDIRRVLKNIVSLRIRGEYRDGADQGGLDSVALR